MDNIIDGRSLAQKREQELKESLKELKITPRIVSVLVGEDPSSVLYTQIKQKKAQELGISFQVVKFPANANFAEVNYTIIKLNQDTSVNGIMVQLPLPEEFLAGKDPKTLLETINPQKDIDG